MDGVPTSSLQVALNGGAGGSGFSLARLRLAFRNGAKDALKLRAKLSGAGLDPAAQDVAVTLSAGAQTIYTRTFPAGTLQAGAQGTRFVFRDPRDVLAGRAKLRLARTRRRPNDYTARLAVRNLDFAGIDASVGPITLTLQIGGSVFRGDLPCTRNASATAARCSAP